MNVNGMRALGTALSVALLVAATAAPVEAVHRTRNYLDTDATAAASPLEFDGTGTATTKTWTTQGGFDGGTVADGADTAASPGDVTLLRPTPVDPDFGYAPWWNTAWLSRECFDVDYTAGTTTLTNHPVHVAPSFSAGGDLRAVADDDTTEVSLWLDGAGALDTVGDVWVVIPTILAGSSTYFCLYYDNPSASSVSSQAAVFGATLTDGYVQLTGAATAVDVVSYSDGNVVSNGTDLAYLDAGETHRFTANNGIGTVFSSLAPINGRGDGNGNDMLVPIWWKGTEFIIPTTRHTSEWYIYAPDATATVQMYNGATHAVTNLNVPAGTTVSVVADITGNNTGLLTSNQPIVLGHLSTNNNDSLAVYPSISSTYGWTTDVYGINTTYAYYGSNTNGNVVTVARSDGTGETPTVNANTRVTSADRGSSQGGDGRDAYHVTAPSPVGIIQQADGDGSESTMFLPIHQLSNQYLISRSSQYVAFSCPTSGTVIDVGAFGGSSTSFNCNDGVAALPDHLVIGGYPAGTHVRSQGGEVFYIMYEDSGDETNVIGPNSGEPTQYLRPTVATYENAGIYSPTGSWTSEVRDTLTNGTFGDLIVSASVPAGSNLRLQIATSNSAGGPFAFYGPDGTTGTYYEPPFPSAQAIADTHDLEQYVQVQATLDSSSLVDGPVLSEVTIECSVAGQLQFVGGIDTVTIPVTAGVPTALSILSVLPSGGWPGTTQLEFVSASNLGNLASATLQLDASSTQIVVTLGSVTQSVGSPLAFADLVTQTIDLNVTATAAGVTTTVDFVWKGRIDGTGPVIEHDLRLVIQS